MKSLVVKFRLRRVTELKLSPLAGDKLSILPSDKLLPLPGDKLPFWRVNELKRQRKISRCC